MKLFKVNKIKLLKLIWILFGFLLIIITFFPIIWMLLCSIRPNIEVFAFPVHFIPNKLTLSAYKNILSDFGFLRAILNTFIVSGSTTLLSLILATLGSYGFSRYKFFGKDVMRELVLTTQMLPIILLALPFFILLSKINLYDTIWGLIISYTSFTLPFCFLTMIGFVNKIPASLDEAALIDGCSRMTAFIKILLPLCKSGLVATGVFAFIYAWNEYLMAVVLTSSEKVRMLTVVIGSKIGQYDIVWNELMAITVIASIPLIIIYAFLQRYFVKGLTAGGVKM
jgi:multiple sugar transport system permease protein